MHIGPAYPSNQLFSVVGRPISRSPRAWPTVSISCTWPPGFTKAPTGPSTDMLKISFFWVTTPLQRRQQNTVLYNQQCNQWCWARPKTAQFSTTPTMRSFVAVKLMPYRSQNREFAAGQENLMQTAKWNILQPSSFRSLEDKAEAKAMKLTISTEGHDRDQSQLFKAEVKGRHTRCLKKTSPTFLNVTWKLIIRFW